MLELCSPKHSFKFFRKVLIYSGTQTTTMHCNANSLKVEFLDQWFTFNVYLLSIEASALNTFVFVNKMQVPSEKKFFFFKEGHKWLASCARLTSCNIKHWIKKSICGPAGGKVHTGMCVCLCFWVCVKHSCIANWPTNRNTHRVIRFDMTTDVMEQFVADVDRVVGELAPTGDMTASQQAGLQL